MKKAEIEVAVRKAPLVRGKYTNLLRQGTNVAILDPDVVEHFPDSESVNHALRAFLAFGRQFEALVGPNRIPPTRSLQADQEFAFDPRTGRDDKIVATK